MDWKVIKEIDLIRPNMIIIEKSSEVNTIPGYIRYAETPINLILISNN